VRPEVRHDVLRDPGRHVTMSNREQPLCDDEAQEECDGIGHALKISLHGDLIPQDAGEPDERQVEQRDSDNEAGGNKHFREIGTDEWIKAGIVGHQQAAISG
jgi:hypothetical protein